MNRARFLLPLLLLSACDDGESSGVGGGGAIHGLAVVNSDYMSTVLSLVDISGTSLIKDDCLDSGAVSPTLSLALSGDVVLAGSTQPGGEVLLLDRTNSALDWVDPAGCSVRLQATVGHFAANPHDVVALSASKVYVTRYESNPTPGLADANDGGNDVVVIDPRTGAIRGRIDMAPYAGANVQSRPDRMIAANGKVYVTLNNLDGGFKAVGAGLVAVIDPAKDAVTSTLDLSPYKNCSAIDYVAAQKRVIVACGGDYLDTPENMTAQSAIVVLDVSGATPRIEKAIGGGSATNGRAISNFVMAAAGNDLVLALTAGDAMGPATDVLWAVRLDAGSTSEVFHADAGFTVGGIAYLPEHKTAVVTDASFTTPLLRAFDVSDPGAIKAGTTFASNPKSGLPPRLIGRY
jgi:hypothetical protein